MLNYIAVQVMAVMVQDLERKEFYAYCTFLIQLEAWQLHKPIIGY